LRLQRRQSQPASHLQMIEVVLEWVVWVGVGAAVVGEEPQRDCLALAEPLWVAVTASAAVARLTVR